MFIFHFRKKCHCIRVGANDSLKIFAIVSIQEKICRVSGPVYLQFFVFTEQSKYTAIVHFVPELLGFAFSHNTWYKF